MSRDLLFWGEIGSQIFERIAHSLLVVLQGVLHVFEVGSVTFHFVSPYSLSSAVRIPPRLCGTAACPPRVGRYSCFKSASTSSQSTLALRKACAISSGDASTGSGILSSGLTGFSVFLLRVVSLSHVSRAVGDGTEGNSRNRTCRPVRRFPW